MVLCRCDCFVMTRRPPRSTRAATLFPTRRAADLRRAVADDGGRLRGFQYARHPFVGLLYIQRQIGRSRWAEHTSELSSLMRSSYAVSFLRKRHGHQRRPPPYILPPEL